MQGASGASTSRFPLGDHGIAFQHRSASLRSKRSRPDKNSHYYTSNGQYDADYAAVFQRLAAREPAEDDDAAVLEVTDHRAAHGAGLVDYDELRDVDEACQKPALRMLSVEDPCWWPSTCNMYQQHQKPLRRV